MFKKIIALLMIFVMSLGTVTAFGAQKELSQETIVEDGFQKTIQYIGDNEIVTWDDGNKVYVEQYDLDGNLVETAIGNRDNKEVEVTNEEGSYTVNSEDIIEIVDSTDIPSIQSSSSSYTKVASIKAYNPLTSTKKNNVFISENRKC